jgi:signal transduction histidine kinase
VRRRVLLAIISITAIAVALFGVPLAIVVGRFVDNDATLQLERRAVLASRDVPGDFATSDDPVELPEPVDGIEFALYDADGNLVTGSGPARADAVTNKAFANRVVDSEADEVRIVAVPVASEETVVGAIRAAQSTHPSDARLHKFVALIAGLGTLVIGVGAAIGYLVARRLSRPVELLRDAAIQLGDGDFAVDVPRSSVPELDDAGKAMTATARRLDDILRRERAFTADASHQLRTPLAGLRAALETEIAFPRADSQAVLRESLADVDRLETTIEELLRIARTRPDTQAATNVAGMLSELAAAWAPQFDRAGRVLTVSQPASDAPVVASPLVVRHALDVLMDNALCHGAGPTHLAHVVTAETVAFAVLDQGPGFCEPPMMARMADSKRGSDESTHGLGLPLAQRLVESISGRLVIKVNGPNPTVEIIIPRDVRPNQHKD